MPDDCSNCHKRCTHWCKGQPATNHSTLACDGEDAGHYFGSSPRAFPNASKGEPAILCGICYKLLIGRRGAALEARAGY